MAASRNPYHRGLESSPATRRSVIAWMDILGYLEMIKEAERNSQTKELLTCLYGALNKGRQWLEEKGLEFAELGQKDFFALKAFTDNIVIGWPVHTDAESELGSAFFKVGIFQLEMAIAGFFVRGAISVGDAYIDDVAVFGPGITEAYEGESQRARDPRIILTDSAVAAAKEHITYYAKPAYSPHSRDIFRDADGQWFLNYLDAVLLAEDDHGPFFDQIVKHKDSIQKRLQQFRDRPVIWSKYAWVANYHNFFCDQHPKYFDDSHKIGLDEFQMRPSTITGDV